MWVEPEIRDSVVKYVNGLSDKSGIPVNRMLSYIGLCRVKPRKRGKWVKRAGTVNRHNGKMPKSHWLTPEEITAIKNFAKDLIYAPLRKFI